MLDRAGYADGDIDFGSNDLTRLPHLIVVGDIARVHGRTACAHGSTQLVSQRNDILLEGLAVLQCPAAGDDHFGGGEFRPFTLDDFRTAEAGNALVASGGNGLDGSAAAFKARLVEASAAHGGALLGVGRLDCRDRVACIGRRSAERRVGREWVGTWTDR